MAPRRAPASPVATTSTSDQLHAPSPARSTRSTRSRGQQEDDWETESMQSFKQPYGKSLQNNGLIGFKDTSVNVAAAFHAAQTGHVPATAKTAPPRSKAPRRGVTPQPTRPQRALSPAEQLADVARALSPVRFFLRETGTGEDESDYNSFGSLGMANQSTSSTNNNNTSYDYQQEEEWVRAAQAKAKANGHARNGSDAKRRKKAMAEDMPYRPGEDDHAVDSSGESEEGEGIVRSGALDGRAETRGKRKEKGEGYLGMGLGLQQRRKKGRRSDESDGRDHDHGQLDVDGPRVRTPSRSPTPNLLRAFSPALARVSPAPNGRTFQPRRRPSSLRTIITNILHGIVLALRFVVELLGGAIDKLALQPVRSIAGSGKMMMKRAKRDWWKWLGVLLALSMALRLLNRPKGFTPPDLPPASMEELISRLTSLEQALSTLSTSTNGLTEDAHEGKKSIRSMADRVGAVEENLVRERKRLDTEYNSIRSDVSALSSQADTGHKAVASAQSTLKALERVSHDVQALKSRVDKVEKENALDDGRIRSALDRMLPDYMPVKWKSGAIVIEPVFWAELKKIMATKKEVDGLLDAGKLDERLEQWVISRSEFLQVLESEMDILKSKLDERRPPTIPHGDASTSLLQELIDAALLRYSKDTLAKPDYALFTAGARVVPSITSDTLVLKPASALGRWFGGKRDVEGRSPATALYPDNTVGSCWPFKDAQGQLGVLLNRRVIVTDVTVEHAAEELALDVSTAPKLIEVWGLVEGEENRAKVSAYLEDHPQSSSSVPPSANHLLLSVFSYDPHTISPIQTFPIAPEIIELGIEMGIIIFRIESNWGGEFTCLYRVRVHGTVVDDASSHA